MRIGIDAFPCAMIWSISFELQYPLSCRRPLARHVWSAVISSNFQRGNSFAFGGAVWPAAFLAANVMNKSATAIERVLRAFSMSVTLSLPVDTHKGGWRCVPPDHIADDPGTLAEPAEFSMGFLA